MPERHPSDLLDYLYEELSPEKMAEARAHIAACPECLEELKRIKETVKGYRALPRPRTPAGLAAKVAAAANARPAGEIDAPAVEQATGESPIPSPPRKDTPEPVVIVRRSWFFHPAWTVAASVILVCAVLIHLSPRRNLWIDTLRPAANAKPAAEPTPPSPAPETVQAPQRDNAAPLPGVGAPPEETPASKPPPPAGLTMAKTLVSEKTAATPAQAPTQATPTAPVAPIAPAAPAQALSREQPMGAGDALFDAARDESDAISSPSPRPAPPSRAAVTSKAAPAAEPMPFIAPRPAAAPPMAGERRKEEEGAPPPAPPGVEIDSDKLEEMLGGAGPAPGGQAAIVDLTGGGEPPRLIERPEPVDTNKQIQDLLFLIGMQLGEKEFTDARTTIKLLRRYDPDRADRILATLEEMERQAEAEQPQERVSAPEADGAAAPAGESSSHKGKYAPAAPEAAESGTQPDPETPEAPPMPQAGREREKEGQGQGEEARPARPDPPPLPQNEEGFNAEAGGLSRNLAEPSQPTAAAPQFPAHDGQRPDIPSAAEEKSQSNDHAIPTPQIDASSMAPAASPERMEPPVSDTIEQPSVPIEPQAGSAAASRPLLTVEPPLDSGPIHGEPTPFEPAPASPLAIDRSAAALPVPDHPPPTLGESGGHFGGRSGAFPPPQRRPRPFTTDPYLRGD